MHEYGIELDQFDKQHLSLLLASLDIIKLRGGA